MQTDGWFVEGPEEIAAVKDLEVMSDRAAAIVIAALVEQRLSSAIKSRLQQDQTIIDRLRGALERRPPSLPSRGAVVPRGLLLALYFQIVGILIAHRSFTFLLSQHRNAAQPRHHLRIFTSI